MGVRVREGRRFRFAGKEYGPGEEVVGVPDKALRVLTHYKGPLEYSDRPSNPTDLPPPPSTDDIEALRNEYKTTVGRAPFRAWDAAQIKEKLNTYRRRDMRAE